MNSSLRKFILLVITLLLAADSICPPPMKQKDILPARLLKGDLFKLDAAEYFTPQSVKVEGNTQVKFEPMLSSSYRDIPAPKYTYKNKDGVDQSVVMNNCLFGAFSQLLNWALCGSG